MEQAQREKRSDASINRKKSTIAEGLARVDKLKRDTDVMGSLMTELLYLLHDRDVDLFREADAMIENAFSRLSRLRRNAEGGQEFVGRWALSMDNLTEEEANKGGTAYIEIDQNLEGTALYGDILAKLKGELTDDAKVFTFSWQGSRGVQPLSGVGRLRFADFHRDEDRLEGVFDIDKSSGMPEELLYSTFRAQRQLDTLIEEFFGL